jgi:4a-hydroxytetrahydrobiopterin dehydratase
MERKLLGVDEIEAALEGLGSWTVKDKSLSRRFEFTNFAQALAFVNRVGEIAETLDHHPDITFGWGYAEIVTTTHDRGGVTGLDVELAKQIDQT